MSSDDYLLDVVLTEEDKTNYSGWGFGGYNEWYMHSLFCAYMHLAVCKLDGCAGEAEGTGYSPGAISQAYKGCSNVLSSIEQCHNPKSKAASLAQWVLSVGNLAELTEDVNDWPTIPDRLIPLREKLDGLYNDYREECIKGLKRFADIGGDPAKLEWRHDSVWTDTYTKGLLDGQA